MPQIQPTNTRTMRTRHASRARRAQEKQDLRQAILQAASREFLEHGYESFSLRRVAERIGYSATTIYLYFKNKDELLLATVQDGFVAFDADIQQAAKATHDPVERIAVLGRTYITFGLDNPELYRLMFMQRSDFYFMPHLIGSGTLAPVIEDQKAAPAGAHHGAPHRAVAQELLVEAVETAMRAKLIRPNNPLLIADSLWASVHGLVALANSPLMIREHAEQVADQLLRVLIAGLK